MALCAKNVSYDIRKINMTNMRKIFKMDKKDFMRTKNCTKKNLKATLLIRKKWYVWFIWNLNILRYYKVVCVQHSYLQELVDVFSFYVQIIFAEEFFAVIINFTK